MNVSSKTASKNLIMKVSHLILGGLLAAAPFALKSLQGPEKQVCLTSNCAIPIPQEVLDQRELAHKQSQSKKSKIPAKNPEEEVEKL